MRAITSLNLHNGVTMNHLPDFQFHDFFYAFSPTPSPPLAVASPSTNDFLSCMGKYDANFCSITRGDSPSSTDKIPSIIIIFCLDSSADFLRSLFANG